MIQVRDGTLYLYGGIYEDGDRQLTYSDFYSLDVHKMDEWAIILAEDKNQQEWHDSDSSDSEDDGKEGAKAPKAEKKKMEGDDSDEDGKFLRKLKISTLAIKW